MAGAANWFRVLAAGATMAVNGCNADCSAIRDMSVCAKTPGCTVRSSWIGAQPDAAPPQQLHEYDCVAAETR